MLTDVEKGNLLIAAGYQCEYCKRQLLNTLYEIDHIYPESRGGLTTYQNLAVSCARCNRNKGSRAHWIDPFTGSTFLLFNPRTMKWSEHFQKNDSDIRGKTTTGRATAALLFRNTPQFLPPDLQWNKIGRLYENQPVYYFLNHLRYRRLRNDFQALLGLLMSPLPTANLPQNQLFLVEYVKSLLLLELYFTRSTLSDVREGIKMGQRLLIKYKGSRTKRGEIQAALSVLHQQRATIRYEEGDSKGAISDQKKAYQMFVNSQFISAEYPDDDQKKVFTMLKSLTVKSKFQLIDFSSKDITTIQKTIRDMNDWYSSAVNTYLTDLILSAQNVKSNIGEKLYSSITDILSTGGYGTDTDYARTIPLRRRWWILHLLYGTDSWQDTLISDMKLWQKTSMFNEIREFQLQIKNAKRLFESEKIYNDVLHIISSSKIT